MRSILITLAIFTPLVARAAPLAVSIVADSNQTRVHRGDTFGVRLTITNPTKAPIAFDIMSCSWAESWRASDPVVVAPGVDCTRNGPTRIVLQPGAADRRTLQVVVEPNAALGAHAVRFGFTPHRSNDTVWSGPTTIAVVDVVKDIAIASKPIAPRGFAFALANTTTKPVAIADELVVQERQADGTWIDFTSLSASHCKATCTTLDAHGSVGAEWAATACADCDSCLSTPFVEAGTYRLVAQSCDGHREIVGGVLSLPPD